MWLSWQLTLKNRLLNSLYAIFSSGIGSLWLKGMNVSTLYTVQQTETPIVL